MDMAAKRRRSARRPGMRCLKGARTEAAAFAAAGVDAVFTDDPGSLGQGPRDHSSTDSTSVNASANRL